MDDTDRDDLEALIQFLYMAPIGLLQARADGEILMVNPLCAQLLMPLSRDGGLSNLFTALAPVAPDLAHRAAAFGSAHGMVCDALQLRIDAGPPERREPQFLSLSLLKLDPDRLMAVLSDVTQATKRDRELRQSQTWIHTIVGNQSDYALLPLDRRGCVLGWNPGIGRLTGLTAQAIVGRSYACVYPDNSLSGAQVTDRLLEAEQHGWTLDEGWRCRADGSRFWGSCLIAPLPVLPDSTLPVDTAFSLVLRDISDRREANDAMRRSVLCDHLTGLSNRRAFFEAAELELQRWARTPRPLALVAFDADHFKRVNDAHGHAAGDAVLRHLAAGLGVTFREGDVVARVGGEEFVALLPGTGLDGALAAAERLCASVARQPVDIDGQSIRYTVSAGVAVMEPGVNDLVTLMKRADAALYLAKANGRNRVEHWRDSAAPTAPRPVPA